MNRLFISKVFNNYNFLILFLFFIFISLQLIYPLADPPAKDMYCFGVYLLDEGFRVVSAKERAISNLPYNTIIMLNRHITFFPVIHFIYYVTFKIFGSGFLQARLTSIFFGILNLFIFYLILRRILSKELLILCFYLFGMNHIIIFYSRLALAESIFLFFVLLGLYFSINFNDKKSHNFISGLINGILIFTKQNSIPFIISNLFLYIKNLMQNFKRSFIKFIFFITGFLSALIFILLIIFFTKSFELFYIGTSKDIVDRITFFINSLIINFYNYPPFNVYSRSPIQAYLGLCFIYIVAIKIIKRLKYNFFEIFAFIFVILTSIMIAIFSIQPIRYHMALIPIFIIGYGILLSQRYILFLENYIKNLIIFNIFGYFIIINLLWLLDLFFNEFKVALYIQNYVKILLISISLIALIFYLNKNYWKRFNGIQILCLCLITFLFVSLITNVVLRDCAYFFIDVLNINSLKFFYASYFILPFLITTMVMPLVLLVYTECFYIERKKEGFSKLSITLIILLFISSFFDIFIYGKWLRSKKYTVYQASKEISEITQNKGVIFGYSAPTLSIENRVISSSRPDFLPEYILFFRRKNIPIYLLFSSWKDYERFMKKYYNILSFYGVKNYIFIKEFKVLDNYDMCADLLLFYVSFY